ncbi:MAG: tail fiber domain-containing protein [Verrucomicrobia bacterium]|nr:tail fiber domain-containing protein [Verrucomicrobiota bacterium]
MKTFATLLLTAALTGTTFAQALEVSPNGNVGIGTTTPDRKLVVVGKVNIGETPQDYWPGGQNWNYTLQLNGQDWTSIGFHDAGHSVSSIRYNGNGFVIGGDDGWGAKNAYFPGSVGIGNTSPQHRLHVSGRTKADSFEFDSDQGSPNSYLVMTTGGYVDFQSPGFDVIEFAPNPALLSGASWEHFKIFRDGGNVGLQTTGTSFFAVNGGNVGIGTTSPAYKLDVAGDIRTNGSIYSAQRPNFFLAMQGDRNVVLYDNGGAIWKTNTYASDIRIKENIVPVAPVLESLEKIRVVEFNYKPGVADDKRHIGVIAQEVEALYPDFVYTDSQSGRKLVQYDMLSTLAIQGVKELNAEHKAALDELRAEIAALRAEIQLLKNRP